MMDGVMLHPAIVQIASAARGAVSGPRCDQPVDRGVQAGLLEDILVRLGPGGLLGAGRHLDIVANDPIVLALLYLELLSRIGCGGISCAFPDAKTRDRDVFLDGRPDDVPADRTGRWRIGWRSFEASRSLPGLDELLLRDLPADLTDRSLSAQVDAVVQGDLSRSWKLASVASQLVISPRTLQRRLRDEGRSFSEIVRAARLATAQDLLGDPTRSVTEIGYVTGFADTAHFTRTFKDALGASPTEWRRARAAGESPTGRVPT